MRFVRDFRIPRLGVLLACVALAAGARAEPPGSVASDKPAPSFAELEAAGATIGVIRVDPRNIFDATDPHENGWFYRLANHLHAVTRPRVVERLLLFKPGDRVSVRVIEETERLLRDNHLLYDVAIVPAAVHDGVVDIDIVTRDAWSLDLTGRYGRSGGTNSTSFGVLDYNFLGTATTLGLANNSDVDRHGSVFQVSNAHLLDGWTAASYQRAHYNDGERDTASFARPFYALDARWAAGASWDRWNRIDTIYNAGDTVAGFRHRSTLSEAYGGWSPGLANGWVQRISAGITQQDHKYAAEPGQVAPAPFPVDHAVRGPFLRHEVVEDRFVKLYNRDQIARPEFFEMGLHSTLQVTRALEGWGATRSAWLYSATVSRGFTFFGYQDLLASATAQRQVASTGEPLTQVGGVLRYYVPQSRYAAFYGLLSGDRVASAAAAPDELLIGGDNGLRGYPLRYQSGDRRVLVTLEERGYTDWYPFHIVRVGGAVFFDHGRAWGGPNQNTVDGGWLSDAGIGLRLALDRAAFGNVLHADIAMPFSHAPGVKRLQFLVKTQATF